MKIKVKLNKDSSFNNELHFFHCLEDLLERENGELRQLEMEAELSVGI